MSEAAVDNLLAEQFDDIEQQQVAAKLGMWIFLATEVLFFGGLFLGYTVYRYLYPDSGDPIALGGLTQDGEFD
jgi:heme/copper-type cytochrome/quinol oxidase subunit 3